MNKEEQKIAIAEACGWKYVEGLDVPSLSFSGARKCGDCWVCPKRGAGYGEYEPPNYLTNLNAMHEAEKVLIRGPIGVRSQASTFRVTLYRIFERDGGNSVEWGHATAAQRAEAFLKTIGKWEI